MFSSPTSGELHDADARPDPPRSTLVGTTLRYRGRRYTITEEPRLIDNAGIAEVVNTRGGSNWLCIAVDDAGHIIRAATRNGPWATVTTEPARPQGQP